MVLESTRSISTPTSPTSSSQLLVIRLEKSGPIWFIPSRFETKLLLLTTFHWLMPPSPFSLTSSCRLRDLENGKEALSLTGFEGDVVAVEWAVNGQVITSCKDQNMRVFDPRSKATAITVRSSIPAISTGPQAPQLNHSLTLSSG